MNNRVRSVETTRASRDGHEYHEAWTARKAMQLLLPRDGLIAIAVEGLQPVDQQKLSKEAIEIADLTLYYGDSTFENAQRVRVVQFKYSVSAANKPFRVSDAKDTLAKFGASFADHKRNYGPKRTHDKLRFDLITNRPIYGAFSRTIEALATGVPVTREIEDQAAQFAAATQLTGKNLTEFAKRCQIIGIAGNLPEIKRDLSRYIVDWSASSDSIASARLGALRQLIRDKAGHAGTYRNMITRIDILHVLGLQEVADLLPCPPSLPDVGDVVNRAQLESALETVAASRNPLVIHAAGGVGKTVFLQSLAKSLSKQHEVVFFDCFGGGSYRAPDDARHLAKRGLVHIVNALALRGLCDPVLPGSDDEQTLLKTFRRRMNQCVQALKSANANRELILFIDAIDNAWEQAKDKNENAFPRLLLESIQHNGPFPNVKVVVSCRSHRKDSVRDIACDDFMLLPFDLSETTAYLRARIQRVSQTEIQVAQARSEGNARILEHLASSDRGLLDPSEIERPITLDSLLQARITSALSEAVRRGYKQSQINAFLAGLAVLPPPVPLNEYAAAHRMDLSAIESFAADLAPLLERTKHGLMFRDEPTETLIRDTYVTDADALRQIARNLYEQQSTSVYAARVLPFLLQKLKDGAQLYKLAFDDRFPETITSIVGRRNIRNARLKAAVLHAASEENYDQLVHLFVELSTMAAAEQRGTDYIVANPDLVIAANDSHALTRLFEVRTKWPGTRHARLTIANVLAGDTDDAHRHAVSAIEWIHHDYVEEKPRSAMDPGPEHLDFASIPLWLIAQDRHEDAISFIGRWKDWYSYEIFQDVFALLARAKKAQSSPDYTSGNIGSLTAALSFLDLTVPIQKRLVKKLERKCRNKKSIEISKDDFRGRTYRLGDGLRKAAAMALSVGENRSALAIAKSCPHERPRLWTFQDAFSHGKIFPLLFHVALHAAARSRAIREQDLLPSDLLPIATERILKLTGEPFKAAFKKRLTECIKTNGKDAKQESSKRLSYEESTKAERLISTTLPSLITITTALAHVLRSRRNQANKPFLALLKACVEAGKGSRQYGTSTPDHFFRILGLEICMFVLWTRDDLSRTAVRSFLKSATALQMVGAVTHIQIVSILAKRPGLADLALTQTQMIKGLIAQEDDVTQRSGLYASFARALLPASPGDASEYFKIGLDQLDAVGSGDMEFTNELLIYAASTRGGEVSESDHHTLTNISELNMYESDKFPWQPFAAGLAKVGGCSVLAKLTRWDDREKASLEYTLLPYLTGLLREGKIMGEDAIALNELAAPVELHSCNTAAFAEAVDSAEATDKAAAIGELVDQFLSNHPGVPMESTVESLASIADRVLGRRNPTTQYLKARVGRFGQLCDELNSQSNYHSGSWPGRRLRSGRNLSMLLKLARQTDPSDESSLVTAITTLNTMQDRHELWTPFFDLVRPRVAFGKRALYAKLIAGLDHLGIYQKLGELKRCADKWSTTSASLTASWRDISLTVLRTHTNDFHSYGHLSGHYLTELSELGGVPTSSLTIELAKGFAVQQTPLPAGVWLGMASMISDAATAEAGLSALTGLLKNSAAKLTANLPDGEWKLGLYPPSDIELIASGMLWLRLGSPRASERWRAARAARTFAKFGRWNILDALIARFDSMDALPFQAAELRFYYLHARLWLLIVLARIAMDDPRNVSRHSELLMRVVSDKTNPHILMRHFASQALLSCVNAGELHLPKETIRDLQGSDQSPFPRLRKRLKDRNTDGFFQGRPKSAPNPDHTFSLDYDFEKTDVSSLADVFGQPNWRVKDLIGKRAHALDPGLKSMWEHGGAITWRHAPAAYHVARLPWLWPIRWLACVAICGWGITTEISRH